MYVSNKSFIYFFKIKTKKGSNKNHKSSGLDMDSLNTNTRKNFFIVRATEHWNNLPREAVESPSLQIFKTCLDAYLCKIL